MNNQLIIQNSTPLQFSAEIHNFINFNTYKPPKVWLKESCWLRCGRFFNASERASNAAERSKANENDAKVGFIKKSQFRGKFEHTLSKASTYLEE